MEIWNKLINDGNQYSTRQQFEQAKEKYIKAIERTEFLYFNCSNTKQVVDMIVESHEKLLECLISSFQFEIAGSVILQSHRVITGLMYHTTDDSDLHSYMGIQQKKVKNRIFELLSIYPEIVICDDCYLNIFGYPQQDKQTKFYTIN